MLFDYIACLPKETICLRLSLLYVIYHRPNILSDYIGSSRPLALNMFTANGAALVRDIDVEDWSVPGDVYRPMITQQTHMIAMREQSILKQIEMKACIIV